MFDNRTDRYLRDNGFTPSQIIMTRDYYTKALAAYAGGHRGPVPYNACNLGFDKNTVADWRDRGEKFGLFRIDTIGGGRPKYGLTPLYDWVRGMQGMYKADSDSGKNSQTSGDFLPAEKGNIPTPKAAVLEEAFEKKSLIGHESPVVEQSGEANHSDAENEPTWNQRVLERQRAAEPNPQLAALRATVTAFRAKLPAIEFNRLCVNSGVNCDRIENAPPEKLSALAGACAAASVQMLSRPAKEIDAKFDEIFHGLKDTGT
jgi:hypothetical protein